MSHRGHHDRVNRILQHTDVDALDPLPRPIGGAVATLPGALLARPVDHLEPCGNRDWLVLGMNEIRRRMTDELVRKPAEHLSDLFAHRDNHGGGIANDGDRHSVRFGRRNVYHPVIIAQFDLTTSCGPRSPPNRRSYKASNPSRSVIEIGAVSLSAAPSQFNLVWRRSSFRRSR